MPRRAFLTADFVETIQAPDTGELWIADTKIKGFGVRVRRQSSGKTSKSFCFRYVDSDQRQRRKTFAFSPNDWDFWLWGEQEAEQASIKKRKMEEAREWARGCLHDERDILRKMPTYEASKDAQTSLIKQRMRKLSLGDAAELLLKGMKTLGNTNASIDRLRSLFYKHLADLEQKHVYEVSVTELREVLSSRDLSEQNLRVLRPFLKAVFEHKMMPYHCMRTFLDAVLDVNRDFMLQNESTISHWTVSEYKTFLTIIEHHDHHWQQAVCLLIYLDCDHAPLKRAMAANWSDMYIVSPKEQEYGGWPTRSLKFIRWKYGNRRWNFADLSDRNSVLIEELFQRRDAETEQSSYLFPSPFGRQLPHISSIEHVWRSSLKQAELPYTSPRQFRIGIAKNRAISEFLNPLNEYN